jgi:hypothetical protein
MVELIIFAVILCTGAIFLGLTRSNIKKQIEEMPDNPTFFKGQGVIGYRSGDSYEQADYSVHGDYAGPETVLLESTETISILESLSIDKTFLDLLQDAEDETSEHPLSITIQDALTVVAAASTRKVGKSYHYNFSQKELADQGVVVEDLPLFESMFVRVAGDVESIKAGDFTNSPDLSIYVLITAPSNNKDQQIEIELEVTITDPSNTQLADAVFIETTTETLRGINNARRHHRSSAI